MGSLRKNSWIISISGGLKSSFFSYSLIGDTMKIFLLLLFLFIPFHVSALSAESYVVMDYDSGRVLMGDNVEKEKLIASTTKIMTAIIALENKDLQSIRKVGEEVLRAYGSAIYIGLDEEISLKDLLYGLMLRSGNDAAIEIAYHVSGNMENFVTLMNQKAYSLGMSHTVFVNNHGLEEDDGRGNISTAKDMAMLMRYALRNEIFCEIIGTKSYTAKSSTKTYVWQNKNKLLKTYEYQLGGKTGFTEKARRTLVTASRKDDKTVIVVTLNDGNDFQNHKNLSETVFQTYERVQILNKDQFHIEGHDDYFISNHFYALLTKEEKQLVKVNYKLDENAKSEEVGIVEISLRDEILGMEKIKRKEEVKETKRKGFFRRFLGWLFGW